MYNKVGMFLIPYLLESEPASSTFTLPTIAVLENSSDSGMSILSGASNAGNIYFGNVNKNNAGQIFYDHSRDSLSFSTNTILLIALSTKFFPSCDTV